MNGLEAEHRRTAGEPAGSAELERPGSAHRDRTPLLLAAYGVPLVVVLGVLVAVLGGGWIGLAVVVLVVAAALLVIAIRSPDSALRFTGARPADGVDHARYDNLVEGLAVVAGLPKPRLYVVADDACNAFVVGWDPQHASIVVTEGLLDRTNRVELEAVIAHEIERITSHDLRAATVAAALVGRPAQWAEEVARGRSGTDPTHTSAFATIAGHAARPFLPLLARLLHVVVPASTHQTADFGAVALTRFPPGLVGVLDKIHREVENAVGNGVEADADAADGSASRRATAHLWFVDPTPRAAPDSPAAVLGQRFATHPPLTERIEALREL